MASTSVITKSVSVSMATMNALYFVVAGITFLLNVTSAQWDGLGVPDMVAYTGKVFFVSFNSHPVYGDLAVSVQISSSLSSDAGRLPSWLTFNLTTRSLSGVPLTGDQGLTTLSIKTGCVQVKTTVKSENGFCNKSTDVFKLSVLPFSWADFFLPSAGLPVASPAEASYLRSGGSEDSGENICEEDRVIASLVLCASIEDMLSEERLELVTHLSDFLSIPVSSINLESSPSHSLIAVDKGFQMVSAGPGSGEGCILKQNAELIWTLPCSTVRHLTDFVKVLQHNVDGGRLQTEMNAGIVGWYVSSSNSLLTRQTRRRRRNTHRTVVPTHVLSPLRPTTVVADYNDVRVTSADLASPVLHLSPSDFIVASDGDVQESYQTVFPPPITPTSVDILPVASDQRSSLLSSTPPSASSTPPSASSTPPSASILTPSMLLSVASEMLKQTVQPLFSLVEISSTLQHPSHHQPTPSSTTQHPSHHQPTPSSSTQHPSQHQPTPSSSTHHYPVTPVVLLPIAVSTTSPEQILITETPASAIHEFQTSWGTPSHTVVIMSPVLQSPDNTTSIIHGISHSSSSPLSSSYSQFSSLLSVLPTGFVYLVTSRAVEVVALSVPTAEPSDDAESISHSRLSPSATSTANTSRFTHEPSVDPGYGLIERVQSEFTIVSLDAEGWYSTLPMPSPSSVEQMPQSTTIPVGDNELSISALLTPALSLEATSVEDNSNDGTDYDASDGDYDSETTQTLTERVNIVETGESLFEGNYVSASITSVPVLESTADYTIQPTQITAGNIVTSVWTQISSTLTAGNETSTTQTISKDMVERPANNTLYVQNPIGDIVVEPGRLMEYNVSRVFSHVEDGNSSSLALSLGLPSNHDLPSTFWLYLDSERQLLIGLPLHQDIAAQTMSVLLLASHSSGQTATDPIVLQATDDLHDSYTHVFIMKFALNFQQFMSSRRNLTNLIAKIGSFFENNGAQYMTVLSVTTGSLEVSWTNNTLTGTVCKMDAIRSVLSRMVRPGGTVKSAFYRHMNQENQLTEILFEPRGACVITLPTTTTATTTHLVSNTIRSHGLSIWVHVILPVLIAILVFVLIILIIIFCNRRRRHRQVVLNAEKEAVSNDRNPIIFPDELDVDDPSLKAKDPLFLPTDPQLVNQNVPLDSSPTKSSKNQENTRSRDHERVRTRDHERPRSRSQEEKSWKERDRQIREVDNHKDQRRKKDSKRQRDQGKIGGATSTLSCDRPNNHYVEEEPLSRSSTLKSTKSLGAEKRHPRSPPPYWQSQSDPPPYRLPPPYLTDNTEV